MTDPGSPQPASIASPCVRNCCLDDDDICLGCFRSVVEICGWSAASAADKTEILKKCAERREQRRSRKPGRGA
jgi:predicted Fe-S protein YdhL (DUF1289 family)